MYAEVGFWHNILFTQYLSVTTAKTSVYKRVELEFKTIYVPPSRHRICKYERQPTM